MENSFSTKVSGSHVSDYCKMQAAYLCKLIYRSPAGSQGFSTSFPKEIEDAAKNWLIWQDFNKQDECGFVARLYKPKGYDPNAKDDGQLCWPSFVFRGTDFDDFRGLGLIINFNWPGLNEALEKGMNNLKKRIKAYRVETKERLRDKSENDAGLIPIWYEYYHSYAGYKILKILDNINIEEILSTYLNHTLILEDDPNNPGKKAQYNPGEWQEAISGQLTGTLHLGALGAEAQATMDIKIIVRKAENYGDWATNLLQGAGAHTRAYEYAMQYSSDVMADKIKKTQQKQITFAGHSLGGGLATTANYAAHYAAMNTNTQIYGIVFNPAGVNEYTYDAAAKTGKTGEVPQSYKDRVVVNVGELAGKQNENEKPKPVPNLSLALVDLYRVDGEILTQLGLRPQDIPFLIGAMKILKTGLPRPVGNVSVMNPIVPKKEQKDRTNSAQQDQPDFTPRQHFGMLEQLQNGVYQAEKEYSLNPSETNEDKVVEAKTKLMNYIMEGNPDDGFQTSNSNNKHFGLDAGDVHPSIFPLDTQQTIINSHEFKNILKLSEIFANYQTMEKFLGDLIDFVDEDILNGLLKAALSLAQDNSDVDVRSIVNKGTWEGFKYITGRGNIASFKKEVKDLIAIFAISAEFHGMDYVIASLEKKLGSGDKS